MRRGGSVSGAVSLVMIFCVLCLTVFATLTYVTADRERQLAELTAERTAEYYAADAEAARIVAALARGAASDAGTVEAMSGTDDLWDDGSSLYEFRVPASGEQELSVSLRLYPDGKYEILSWSTGYVGGWETNDTINIWDGDF